MRIDVIGTRGFPGIQGGVERHCERLYPQMKGVSVRVFRRKPYVKTQQSQYPGISFTDLPSTRISGFETVLHSLLATLISMFSKAEIVHIHNIGPAMFAPLLRAVGKKVVLTYHSANYEHDKWNAFAKAVLRLSERIALASASQIIFVNKFQMQRYSESVRRKSTYIPNGIVPMSPLTNHDFLDRIGICPQKYILSVGRITPEKGFDLLISAYNRLDTDVKLVIAGAPDQDSKYLEELKSIAGSNPNVVFPGFTDGDNLSQLYTNALAYVLPSRIEGFPLVLLEAINFNLPLLVSDIEATHLLKLSAKSYFKANDANALCDKLSEFLTSGDKGEYKCTEEDSADYCWGKIAEQTIAVYKKAMRK